MSLCWFDIWADGQLSGKRTIFPHFSESVFQQGSASDSRRKEKKSYLKQLILNGRRHETTETDCKTDGCLPLQALG